MKNTFMSLKVKTCPKPHIQLFVTNSSTIAEIHIGRNSYETEKEGQTHEVEGEKRDRHETATTMNGATG